MGTVVLAEGVERAYGAHRVLAGVDLALEVGELVVLLGPNGAGKTTLLRVLATLLAPTAGRLELFGQDAGTRAADVRRRIGYVGHESSCYPDLSGTENLTFHGELFGLSDPAARAAELLAWAGLGEAGRRPVRTYSRGMQQRLSLARALLHRPGLLLLDEPFSGLDQQGVDGLVDRLRELRTGGCTILLSTHDLERVVPIADRTAILDRGRIAWSDPSAGVTVLIEAYQAVLARRSH